jgi:hypothetical protein
MVSVRQLNKTTLAYFHQFSYPLTPSELIFWRHSKSDPESKNLKYKLFAGHYVVDGQKKFIARRSAHNKNSQSKWVIAHQIAKKLSSISTVQAIFVTGALAMNNCPIDDDIDLMIVTTPHTLWITRLRVFNCLNGLRRPSQLPEHSSSRVKDKICDNLYLDSSHLFITSQNIYTAHEILQAKCIFDRGHTSRHFIYQNGWVKKFLPTAYKRLVKLPVTPLPSSPSIFIRLINQICYLLQFIYMRPKITYETISLHTAFFHPRQRY